MSEDFEARAGIIPIPLRADVTVRIHGLPSDMTLAEAEKVANVVKAFAEAPATPQPPP